MTDVTDFEIISDEIMDAPDDGNLKENCIYWLNNDKTATVNFCQGRYISKIKQLAEKYPDKVNIRSEKNGVLVATVPTSAIKVSIIDTSNRKELSEEQIARRNDALSKARESRRLAKRQKNDAN